MPAGLTSITVEYQRNTINDNKDDLVWGELWLMDKDGNLDAGVAWWDVLDSTGWGIENLDAPAGVVS